ncbi:ABC transporter ATP-binding protein [Flavobacterium sp.]|uniref:ABC transporter ATP-binding protein n=1 Tax=Flavobacterium sp. TaxID=239 RepID=UPI002B4AF2DC|nr:ABC transporter ATP-binding protein [Flavobacterium sp.]HLP64333.1 ABC transporter ATP-binding protein [Flavobacterium sp.]
MLTVRNLSFSYLKEATLQNIDFSLERGKNLAVIGESGCGKSTLLKLIYGLYDLDEGNIFWNDVEVLGPKFNLIPGVDSMKYLAQDFDLMPFITVAENVGKYLSNIYPDKKKARVMELLEIVEMTDFVNVKAKTLSGGQMQRVAIARVLALEPELLLLDEPFSHIDNFRKNSLRRKLFSYLKEKQITCIVATHDSTDVLSFADEVLVMKEGTIIEKGTPKKVFETPINRYVASLFGDVNEMEIDGKTYLIYPHQLKVTEKSNLKVTVVHSYFRGNHYLIEAEYNTQTVFFESEVDFKKSSDVCLKKIDL